MPYIDTAKILQLFNKTKIFFKKIAFSFGGSNYFRIFAPKQETITKKNTIMNIISLILISILLLPVIYIDCIALYRCISYITKQVERLIKSLLL